MTFVVEFDDGEWWLCVSDNVTVTRIAMFNDENGPLAFQQTLNMVKLAARECGRMGL